MKFTLKKIGSISKEIQIQNIKSGLLPGSDTILGKPSERKQAIFQTASIFWSDYTPDDWLKMEHGWLTESREKIGSIETGGKNDLDYVISAELLIRVLGTCFVVWHAGNKIGDPKTSSTVINTAISSLNVTFADVTLKGQARMQTIPAKNEKGWQTVYGHLRDHGVMVGTGGGKFLPYPKKSVPFLLSLLDKSKINPIVYW